MYKQKLIKFIENNFTDDNNLVFQLLNKNDVDPNLSDDAWDSFVDAIESSPDVYNGFMADIENKLDEYKEAHCADELEGEYV